MRTRASTQDETAWTVALHLSPWGAAQQIPRESRQDARTGVLWGRRAKRRQPSRPPVNRVRHSQVPTDAARPKNTSAAARKKTSTNHPRDEEKLTTSRRGLDAQRWARETNQMQTFTRAEGFSYLHIPRENNNAGITRHAQARWTCSARWAGRPCARDPWRRAPRPRPAPLLLIMYRRKFASAAATPQRAFD